MRFFFFLREKEKYMKCPVSNSRIRINLILIILTSVFLGCYTGSLRSVVYV